MKIIRVGTKKSYDVIIGSGLLNNAGAYARSLGKSYDKIAIIADAAACHYYGGAVSDSLTAAGYPVCAYIMKRGEAFKNMDTVLEIADFLLANAIGRKSLIVALGGGVTGDTAGFAASIYQRGMDYIHIPTTFLAAIDSSVGGKTAVNIPQGKNLIGAFWQPSLVLCDIDTLATLPEEDFKDGAAEAVKYACIRDAELLNPLGDGVKNKFEEIIARCVAIKAEIVRLDERDQGVRGILNFGHTLGHGLEKLSNFQITHGKAVAIGMVLAVRAGEKAGLTAMGTAEKIEAVLTRLGVVFSCPYPIAQVVAASMGDKKREGDKMNLILLKEIGEAFVYPVPIAEMNAFFD